MGNNISIGARWLSSGLAIMLGLINVPVAIFNFYTGSLLGLVWLAIAATFFVPAWIAIRGGRILYLRWAWGIMVALSAIGCMQGLMQGGLASLILLIWSLAGLALSLLAKEKRPDEDMDLIEPFA